MFSEFTTLLMNLTNTATCDPSQGGNCILSQSCSSYSSLMSYSF